MISGQAFPSCRRSCSPIPGRGCFGETPEDEIVVSLPSPIVEPLDGRLGDISSDRVHDPMRLSSFGDQYSIEPPALPCRDDALVNQGHEVAKVDLDGESDPDVTEIGHVLLAIRKTNFPLQLLPWSFREMSEDKNIGTTTRQTFAKYNRSWHPKAIKTKSRQNMVFDPGGLSGCLCGCPFWEGDARCIVGGVD